jgi:hypothetical protein
MAGISEQGDWSASMTVTSGNFSQIAKSTFKVN